MLNKLKARTVNAVTLQKSGQLSAALGEYDLVCEALRFYEGLGYHGDVENIQRQILEAQSSPALVMYFHGMIQFHRKHFHSAADALHAAVTLAPELPMNHVLLAKALTSLGDLPGALAAYERAQELAPTSGGAREAYFVVKAEQEMPGEDYYDWLQRFHEWIQPATYVEIGLGHGRSLALAGPDTRAIGVDPYQGKWEQLNYVCPHGPATLFPLTSDDFFAKYDLKDVLGRATFDLAFIDGLHLFEQVLKDFINLERYARKDSIVLIHDCLPIAPIVAERERCTGFWTGDVWRIIPCLKTFRPDLKIAIIPTKPSGLGVVTNLDAASTVLVDNYDEIVRYYLSLHCPENFEKLRVLCNVVSADDGEIKRQFGSKAP